MPRLAYCEDLTATTDTDGAIQVDVPGTFDILGVTADIQQNTALLVRVNRIGPRRYNLAVFERTSTGTVVKSVSKQHQIMWCAVTNE